MAFRPQWSLLLSIRDITEDQLRAGSAVLLGALALLLPVLVGRMDVPTVLIVAAIGGVAILPFWRYAGASLTSPIAVLVFLELVVGPIVIGRLFSALAIWTYLGAWVCTLGFLRLASNWRDPQ
jgi:hypothetical protein